MAPCSHSRRSRSLRRHAPNGRGRQNRNTGGCSRAHRACGENLTGICAWAVQRVQPGAIGPSPTRFERARRAEDGTEPAMVRKMRAIGLMSGTSMDGIDVALIDTDGVDQAQRGPSATYPYGAAFRARLRAGLGAAAHLTGRQERPANLAALEA